ncbi:hypothetical protein [Thalassotalea mangrovi]|uniref:Lipoprotein n=1 Tax=Thalassotalea mangrovi TaxID=2572245 RepID=A0A4U1B5S5_9GAMM|nr:hypothetical protein [Thalassotalea mangrovi]TKB45733.1 hypothetical protein E8M12_07325 [Thalassotalea mangrovi]
MMKYWIVFTLLLLSGCSSGSQPLSDYVAREVLENLTGSEIRYNGAACANIKNQCPSSDYSEWLHTNGEVACSCTK